MTGPTGTNANWKTVLEALYSDILKLTVKEHKLTILAIPPIGTDINPSNSEGKVIITPTKAAKIAISTVRKFLQENPNSPLRTIHFSLKSENSLMHFIAYKKAFGLKLTTEEKNNDSEKRYIEKLEQGTSYEKQQQSEQKRENLKRQTRIKRQLQQTNKSVIPNNPSSLSSIKNLVKKINKWHVLLSIGTLAVLSYLVKIYYYPSP